MIGDIDILVLAAGCNLPYGLPASERDFIGEAVRSGVLGPMFLTTRLRLKLSQSHAPGGGCVINTGSVARWLELTADPEDALDELALATARAASNWSGIGVRVNSVIEPAKASFLPRQVGATSVYRQTGSHSAGADTMLRGQPTATEAMAAMCLFLATVDASRLSGQTLHLS